jgi:hypothetical protein
LDDRIYAMQDDNWSVTGAVDSSGEAAERFADAAYGEAAFLDGGFVPQSSSRLDGHWSSRVRSSSIGVLFVTGCRMNKYALPLVIAICGWIWEIMCEVLYGWLSKKNLWRPNAVYFIRVLGWLGLFIASVASFLCLGRIVF